jgi:hypothetical protein
MKMNTDVFDLFDSKLEDSLFSRQIVEALLPQSAASKLCAKHNCLVYYP